LDVIVLGVAVLGVVILDTAVLEATFLTTGLACFVVLTAALLVLFSGP